MNKPQDTIVLPSDPQAEKALLGCFLLDPSILAAATAQIRTDMFHVEIHRWIYNAMQSLHTKRASVDFVTLQDEIARQGVLKEIGGAAYLTEIAMATPTSINWQSYLTIIDKKARRRNIIAAANELAIAAFDETGDVEAVAADVTSKLRPSTIRGKGLRPIKEAIVEVIDRADYMERNPEMLAGIPSTFNALDLILSGFKRGEFTIIAARPSMGKSALAINMVMNQALRWPEMQIAVFTLEMTNASQASRMLANKGNVQSDAIQRGRLMADDWENMIAAANQIAATGIHLDDDPSYTPAQLYAECERHRDLYGLDLVVIDYMGLMGRPENMHRNANTQEVMTAISKALKEMARKLNVPVLALSQLNREVEKRADKRPIMSDLRESGAL
jgi:replicative DNA helicase